MGEPNVQTEAIPKTYYAYFLVMKRAKKRVLRDGIVPQKAYNNLPVPPYFSLFLPHSLCAAVQHCQQAFYSIIAPVKVYTHAHCCSNRIKYLTF